MNKQCLSLAIRLMAIIAILPAAYSCVDEQYKFDDPLNTEMTFFQNGLEIPLGTTPKMCVDSLFKSLGDDLGDFFKKDADGAYHINFSGSAPLESVMEEIKKFQIGSFDGVRVNNSRSVSIADLENSITFDKIESSFGVDVVLPPVATPDIKISFSKQDSKDYEGDLFGKLGSFKIYPKDDPQISLTLELPQDNRYTAEADIKFVLPSIVVPDVSRFGAGISYNSSDNSVTISGELTKGGNVFSIPIAYLHVVPQPKPGEEGIYVITNSYSLNGNFIFATTSAGSMTAHTVQVKYTIPKLSPDRIELDTELSYKLGDRDETINIPLSDIPEQISVVEKVKFDDVTAKLDVDISGIAASAGTFILDGTLILPEFFEPNVFEINEEIVPGTTLHYSKALDCLANVDLSKGAIGGNAKFSGTLKSGDNRVFRLSDFGSNVSTNISVSLGDSDGKIAIEEVKAKIDYEIENDLSVEIEDVPQELRNGATLDLNPVINIAIKTNLGLPATADLILTPVVDGQKVEDRSAVASGISLPVSVDGISEESVFYMITSLPESELPTPEGYIRINCNVSSLLESIPDKIAITAKLRTDKTRPAYFFPYADYKLSLDYAIDVPARFGEKFKLIYSKDVEGLTDFLEALKYGSLGIKGSFTSSLPLNCKLGISFVDLLGAPVDVLENPLSISINSGNGKGEGKKSDINAIIKLKAGAVIEEVAAAKMEIYLSSGKTDVTLSDKDFIQASLAACAPDGLTINPKNL